MRNYRSLCLLLALFLLVGCASASNGNTPSSSTSTAAAPQVFVTHAPPSEAVLQPFLDAWKAEQYASMYGLLTQESQKAISGADFAALYDDSMNKLTLKELDYTLGSSSTVDPQNAVVNFHVTYKTNLIGDLQRDMSANLKLENGQWRIAWDDGLILPELRGGNHLAMDPQVPARGTIYDRNGNVIVSQSDAVALGLVPGQINTDTEGVLLAYMSDLVGLYPGTIQGLYANAGPDWYIPVGEVSKDDFKQKGGVLTGFTGTYFYPYNTRLYANGIAPQAIGYVSPIQKDELKKYIRLGYSGAVSVGRSGVEKWGESLLAGKTGGTLYVFDKDGKPVSELGKSDSQPASSIKLTLDKNLQFQAQKALESFRGAIVVLERDTGRVLAMASSPTFDPNLYDTTNQNSINGISNLVNDPRTPQLNRAAQSKYPLGSVFKVITFAAALESTTYTPSSPIIDCGYHFTEMTDKVRDDWTWEHYQQELAAGDTYFTQPSGPLDPSGALMRSCNPYFWHIGKDLFDQGRVNAIATMARGFGLGKETGIGEIEESAGNITDPTDEVEAVNQAIGQGDVQVTPLQVARMMAAIGNGGTLYRPQLVEQTIDPNGNATQVFKPDANAPPLPITKATLDALQAAMQQVIRNTKGTAYVRFLGTTAGMAIFGKTGTAESGNGDSHAWFAGYTNELGPNRPDIAIAVIAENAGEGSVVAAPMFKRMVEVYFMGKPLTPYPWETSIGITRTPTLPVTPTVSR